MPHGILLLFQPDSLASVVKLQIMIIPFHQAILLIALLSGREPGLKTDPNRQISLASKKLPPSQKHAMGTERRMDSEHSPIVDTYVSVQIRRTAGPIFERPHVAIISHYQFPCQEQSKVQLEPKLFLIARR